MARPILIDCDPGQDDAIMLFMAFAARDQLDIRAITTVAGNVTLEKTARNARLLCDVAKQTDIPIYAGCDRPRRRSLEIADHVHGDEGLTGIPIVRPKAPLATGHGVDVIIDHIRSAPDNGLTLVATGPLTNIAAAIERAPEVLSHIEEIVLMGGALREGGNVTPSAEYNIYVDPEAADIVFACGRPITVLGLDVTHQVITTPTFLAEIMALKNPVAEAAHAILTHYAFFDAEKYGEGGAPLHDPCTIAYLLAPTLFQLKACNLRVETTSLLTLGHTAVDFWKTTDLPANVNWAHGVDVDGMLALVRDLLGRFG